MKYLGVDYGERITGIALSDDAERFAFPQGELVEEDETALKGKIVEYAAIKDAREIVVGYPPEVPGMSDRVQQKIKRLKEHLEADGWTVHLENELLTSKIAEMHSPNKSHASAAALILQSFLDRKNHL